MAAALWVLLSEDERAHVYSWLIKTASAVDLAKVASLSHKCLVDARQERERRTTRWRGGLLENERVKDESLEVGDANDPATVAKRVLAKACDDGDIALVKKQLADGVPVDFFSGPMGETPLCRTVERGHAECARLLLEARAAILGSASRTLTGKKQGEGLEAGVTQPPRKRPRAAASGAAAAIAEPAKAVDAKVADAGAARHAGGRRH